MAHVSWRLDRHDTVIDIRDEICLTEDAISWHVSGERGIISQGAEICGVGDIQVPGQSLRQRLPAGSGCAPSVGR